MFARLIKDEIRDRDEHQDTCCTLSYNDLRADEYLGTCISCISHVLCTQSPFGIDPEAWPGATLRQVAESQTSKAGNQPVDGISGPASLNPASSRRDEAAGIRGGGTAAVDRRRSEETTEKITRAVRYPCARMSGKPIDLATFPSGGELASPPSAFSPSAYAPTT